MSIDSLVEKVDRSEIKLPEIQRSYVWKPSQVAGLVDSLYRGYPSGSLLLWETDAPIRQRGAAIDGPSAVPTAKPLYLLDGQQRLTSLHRLFGGHDAAQVVFNAETERFQIQSAATKRDPRWVKVVDILSGADGLFALVTRLHEKVPQVSPDNLSARLERLKRITQYQYFVEIIENLAYEEVTDIFIRVNSKGKALGAVDLALATLSARWPGVIDKLDEESTKWRTAGYPGIDTPILARSLAAISSDVATLRGFASTPIDALETGWKRVRKGLEETVALLRDNLGLTNSQLIPSMNAIVPVVVYLGLREDKAMPADEASGLLYWLLGAFLLQRFSSAADTAIAQDAAVIKKGDGLKGLFSNLGITGERLTVTEENLIGRGANSPYFLLSYLAARNEGAKDWWYGTKVSLMGREGHKIEYHHIHPKATIKNTNSKAEINDLANLAFISSRANRKIRDRSPLKYFPELLVDDDRALAGHLVPEGPDLRTADQFLDFLRGRRRLLADAMTTLLDGFRPEGIDASAPSVPDPSAGDTLLVTLQSPTHDPLEGMLVFVADHNNENFTMVVPMSEMERLMSDLASGLAGDLLGSDGVPIASVDADAELIEIPVGPLLVGGNKDDWRKVLDREYEDAAIGQESIPAQTDAAEWPGERIRFSVLASD